MHTYLFSGDQFFRYEFDPSDEGSEKSYQYVEQGYPRHISRLKEEPRFREMEMDFSEGIDAAFADDRNVYLFQGSEFHFASDEDHKHYYAGNANSPFRGIQAVAEEDGATYIMRDEEWFKVNHLENRQITMSAAEPRLLENAPEMFHNSMSAVLHGTDDNTYLFAGSTYFDTTLERTFPISEVWGRSENFIYESETIDAAFVGRDGKTYVFSGDQFVQYDSEIYIDNTVEFAPRLVSDKFRGLDAVVVAYVWREYTFLFGPADESGNFMYTRYSKDSYERPDSGFPRQGNFDHWNIPEMHQEEGFDKIDTIFVQDDNLIFISDQEFISYNLDEETWTYPQELDLLYEGIPFNKTNFETLHSGFVGKNGNIYFFGNELFTAYIADTGRWTDVRSIKDHWGLENNVLIERVDATYVDPFGNTYLFSGDQYVRYSSSDYRRVDMGYPRAIASYLRDEPAFKGLPKEFQQMLDTLERKGAGRYFQGITGNLRTIRFLTENSLFVGSTDLYDYRYLTGLGEVHNNLTLGANVDAALVDLNTGRTFLLSGDQYIRYSGEEYRYIDEGYPKQIADGLAGELNNGDLPDDFMEDIDAGFFDTRNRFFLFKDENYVRVNSRGVTVEKEISSTWGTIHNEFDGATTIDGAFVDAQGLLYIFKGQHYVRYSDTTELFRLDMYDDPKYVDATYPREIREFWQQIPAALLPTKEDVESGELEITGADTIFRFEDRVYFHTDGDFVTYAHDHRDRYEEPVQQTLEYRWGEWSDFLLTDIMAISRFKQLEQSLGGGEEGLTALLSGASGNIREPYMHFAKLCQFDQDEVRWVKRMGAFLQDKVNPFEEDFDVETVLRMYDILSTTRRLNVEVEPLYTDVWSKLFARRSKVAAAAEGLYDVLISVDCNNNYQTLVDQIENEINVIKRDALVPYVIANDPEVDNVRQLYQKLLIDIEMSGCGDTSR
ncbi:MAG: hemopexin repeat-containing protein, partial [Bacteroidota bacterium]